METSLWKRENGRETMETRLRKRDDGSEAMETRKMLQRHPES